MYNTNDVGSMAFYGIGIMMFFGFFGLAGAGSIILGLIFIILVSLALAK